MMYATPGDLVARFGETEIVNLTDVENIPPSVIDVERLEIKLADAQSFMDGYIGQVYRLPLTGCVKPPAISDTPWASAVPPAAAEAWAPA